tara:strand:+ start:326 stop:685 length:360 start_codon:yes stop_codon:yes gene_type:complete
MSRGLLVWVALCLSSCILVYDDRDYDYHHEASTVEGFEAFCYRYYNDEYDWYFETWGSPDLVSIDVYINSWKWIPLYRHGYDYWTGALHNTYFYCENSYEFEVVAEDYSGNLTYRVFSW